MKMSDLKKYINRRKSIDNSFAKDYEAGYADFKISVILKKLREDAGVTQEELASKMHTKKSAISRIENKADDILISTLIKFAAVLGKRVHIKIA